MIKLNIFRFSLDLFYLVPFYGILKKCLKKPLDRILFENFGCILLRQKLNFKWTSLIFSSYRILLSFKLIYRYFIITNYILSYSYITFIKATLIFSSIIKSYTLWWSRKRIKCSPKSDFNYLKSKTTALNRLSSRVYVEVRWTHTLSILKHNRRRFIRAVQCNPREQFPSRFFSDKYPPNGAALNSRCNSASGPHPPNFEFSLFILPAFPNKAQHAVSRASRMVRQFRIFSH